MGWSGVVQKVLADRMPESWFHHLLPVPNSGLGGVVFVFGGSFFE